MMGRINLNLSDMDLSKATTVNEGQHIFCIKVADIEYNQARILDLLHHSEVVEAKQDNPNAIVVLTPRDEKSKRNAEVFYDYVVKGSAISNVSRVQIVTPEDFQENFTRINLRDGSGRHYFGKGFFALGYQPVKAVKLPDQPVMLTANYPGEYSAGDNGNSILIYDPVTRYTCFVDHDQFMDYYCPEGSKQSFRKSYPNIETMMELPLADIYPTLKTIDAKREFYNATDQENRRAL